MTRGRSFGAERFKPRACRRWLLSRSAGRAQSRVLRGRSLISSATCCSCSGVTTLRSVPLAEVVSQQAVHVLVAAALPRRVRVTEEHLGPGALGDLVVQRQLLALIPGQCAPQIRLQAPGRGADPFWDRLGA